MLTAWLAAKVSRGEAEIGSADVVVSSAEESAGHVVVPRLLAAKAEMERLHVVEAKRDGLAESLLLPRDTDAMARLMKEVKARLLVVDPVMAHLEPGVNSWKDQEVRRALLPLTALAEETGAAVVLVAHLNKRESSDPLMRLGGSIGLPATARSLLLLGRDPDARDGRAGSRRILAHAKSNLGPHAKSVLFQIETVEIETKQVAAMVAIDESDIQADDLLKTTHGERTSKKTLASEFLRDTLQGGPKPVRELLEEAAELGISDTTLNRAKDELGIISEKADFGGGWDWELPQQPDDEDHEDHGLPF